MDDGVINMLMSDPSPVSGRLLLFQPGVDGQTPRQVVLLCCHHSSDLVPPTCNNRHGFEVAKN